MSAVLIVVLVLVVLIVLVVWVPVFYEDHFREDSSRNNSFKGHDNAICQLRRSQKNFNKAFELVIHPSFHLNYPILPNVGGHHLLWFTFPHSKTMVFVSTHFARFSGTIFCPLRFTLLCDKILVTKVLWFCFWHTSLFNTYIFQLAITTWFFQYLYWPQISHIPTLLW